MNYYNQILIFFLFAVGLKGIGQTLTKESLISDNSITIVDKTLVLNDSEHPIAFGKKRLINALSKTNAKIETVGHWSQAKSKVFIIIGTVENEVISRLISNETELLKHKPEGAFYLWKETTDGLALIIGGTDSNGLLYALTEIAQRIEDKGLNGLTALKNTIEFPDNEIRGVDKFLKDENDDSWFFSEEYWQYYIKQLAENRFNRLTLITGYQDGLKQDFMIPVYPYLLKVPGFGNVEIRANYSRTPKEYLQQLRRIGVITHSYGLEFVFGMWGHGKSDEYISGLPKNDEEFTRYCAMGIRELLRQVPEIDGIHLRVNYESGIGGFGDTAENFWKEIITSIGMIYKERNGKLFLDLRAKGLTVKIREWAINTGIDVTVTSKYTWEGVGLPYHPTEMRNGELTMLDNIDKRQRYGYADFLDKSREFDVIYRLWGIGTMRMFTWADPDYVKRFSYSTSFGGGKGFQVTPPLARKYNTWQLLNDEYSNIYQWEDQRYWAWFKLFGRLGYSTSTDNDVWERSFKARFGQEYKNILEAYRFAGKILPLITTSHLTYHPANYNWAEMDSGGSIIIENNANPWYIRNKRTYQSTEPGDPGLFYKINDYVMDVSNDEMKPKVNPVQLSKLFDLFSEQTFVALSKININEIQDNALMEFKSIEMDLMITAFLAAYHADKIKAATNFAFYEYTQSEGYLNASIISLKDAKIHWEKVVEITQKLYNEEPLFLHDNKTWKDRLDEINKDIDSITELKRDSGSSESKSHWDDKESSNELFLEHFEANIPEVAKNDEDIQIILKPKNGLKIQQPPKVHFRLANMTTGKFRNQVMKWDGTNFVAQIKIDNLSVDFDLIVYFTWINEKGNVIMHPGLFNEDNLMPYYVIALAK